MISKQLEQYAGVLQRVGSLCGNFDTCTRLHCLLGNLIAQSLHHRDITERELTFLLLIRLQVQVSVMHIDTYFNTVDNG